MERFNRKLLLTTTQVADLLAVHPSTVKRWSNEGDVAVDKTEGGHRRIYLQDALELARRRGLATYLDPFTPYEAHVWTAVDQAVSTGSFERVHALAVGWLVRGHVDRLGHLFYELGRHPEISLAALCDEGIRGFMTEVGSLWRSGRLRVGEEHMASERLVESLLALRAARDDGAALGPPPTGRPRAVVGAMEGDRHHLGALCVRLLLERRGWEVFYLGADVPVEDFAAIQRSRGASLVCISFAPPNTAADMMRCVRILGEFYDTAHPFTLALGGDVGEGPSLGDLAPPFRDLGVFGTIGAFDEALDQGLVADGAPAASGAPADRWTP